MPKEGCHKQPFLERGCQCDNDQQDCHFLWQKKNIQIKALNSEILTHWKSGISLLLLSQQQQQQQQNNNNNKSVARFTSRTA